ncbi:MAG: hypothetical protein ABH864_03605 [archaeon]
MKFKIPKTFMGKPVEGAIDRALSAKPTTNPDPPAGQGNFTYSFLEGDFGKEVLAEYNAKADKDYPGDTALKKLSFADNFVKGSNPFAFVLLDCILEPKGIRIASPADLERALEEGNLNLRGTYGDSALVLRNEGEPNLYHAKALVEQIKQRGNFEYPLMIPLRGLDIYTDANSPHGIAFSLTDYTELIHALVLNNSSGSKFNTGDKKGRPILDAEGKRTLYTAEGGVRRLCRYRDLSLSAGDEVLAYSGEGGRVIVCREAARSNSGGSN